MLRQTTQTELALGSTYEGTLTASGQAQLFKIEVEAATGSLMIRLADGQAVDHNEVYARLGSPPTREEYGYRFSSAASANQDLLVPRASTGTWYVLVYGESIPSPSLYTAPGDRRGCDS